MPEGEGEQPSKRKFKAYSVGYVHICSAEIRTEEARLYLLIAIDPTSKFAFVELHQKVTTRVAGDFLRHLIAAVPTRCTRFSPSWHSLHHTQQHGPAVPLIKMATERGETVWAHAFEYVCARNDHRLTKPGARRPSRVERMNRTTKDATVKRNHYDNHDQLRTTSPTT